MSTIDIIQIINKLGGTLLVRDLNKSGFIKLCGAYPELLMERNAYGDVILQSPVFGGTGFRQSNLIYQVGNWCEQYGKGEVGSSNTGFDLPNGATRIPDAFWVSKERMANLTTEDIEQSFLPVVPDFVAELKSSSDKLKKLKRKMQHE